MDPQGSGRIAPLVLLIILATMGIAGISNWLRNTSLLAPTSAQLSIPKGQAEVIHADAGKDQLAAGGTTRLQRGDSVITAPESGAILALAEGNSIAMEESSKVVILDLYRQPISRRLIGQLALEEGAVTIRRSQKLLGGIELTVDTRIATIQVLGSLIDCEICADQRLRVIAHDGEARVSMGEQEYTLASGEQLEFGLGQTLQGERSNRPTPSPIATLPNPTPNRVERTTPLGTVAFASEADEIYTYTVQPGDTLYGIAKRFNLSWKTLLEANREQIADPERLLVGQELIIPQTSP